MRSITLSMTSVFAISPRMEQSPVRVSSEECHNYNEQVAEQQSGGNVHRGVLFDDHGDDVCPASGGVLEKKQGSCDCRQQDRKAKLQRNLIGQRS